MGRLLNRSMRLLSEIAGEYLKQLGYENFRMGHVIMLVHIDLDGTINNVLAQRASVTKQAMSKLVKELQELGFVTTEKHPNDARAILVKLTEKGYQFMLDWKRCVMHIDQRFEEIVGSERLEIVKDILGDLLNYYEANYTRTNMDIVHEKMLWTNQK